MENYELASLTISQVEESWTLTFERAKLMVVHDHGTLSWFIDAEGVANADVLNRFAISEEIAVSLEAVTIGGRKLTGAGYFHPNTLHSAAAIRGVGELDGYSPGLLRQP
ncbi:hypothetical protein COLU111180_09945 [Cohnella lubricantis]|uniref:Uncharacterized protein n=1 Tax=Cohnella lubricantis TaxID=2163172 RepID=A0A841TDR5_9BACL|nr:hypothetical protein [Cohnella lubricantis]MBB6678366.1 hypothetical protein [Cohnella lubricantis]MBP2116746.1 hypothetical protein [Cohnella lubricantis]